MFYKSKQMKHRKETLNINHISQLTVALQKVSIQFNHMNASDNLKLKMLDFLK